MLDVILDSLFDGIKAFFIIFIIYIILSFFQEKISNKLNKTNKLSPLYGSIMGLIPQCGVSVVASDLYLKRSISIGTLIAVFLSCSDEAIPIILSSGGSEALMVIPLIISKFVIGFISGFVIDVIVSKISNQTIKIDNNSIIEYRGCNCGCCIDEDDEPTNFDKHFWYPFIHSLKLFMYIFAINVIFGSFVYLIGEDNLIKFLEFNKCVAPIYAILVGLIPNCASSVILAELFISGALSFGATLSGLCVNAGLGIVFIFKDKKNIKNNLAILLALVLISLLVGYLTCLILGF